LILPIKVARLVFSAVKHGIGKGSVFRGCRAWNNSHDGFDLMEAGSAVNLECFAQDAERAVVVRVG